ncbi:MAG: hypothetical protein V7742_21580 [Halioglobus sp.]
MAHILEAIRGTEIQKAVSILEDAHQKIVLRAAEATLEAESDAELWGRRLKRLEVSLPLIPGVVGKSSEKLVELINILATVERTISALKWFGQEYSDCVLRECHPSTSDDSDGNDIVVTTESGVVRARCEVCDVASSSAGQNGKEKKDIKNLGCNDIVPRDGVRRFIATSMEFSSALTSSKRKWHALPYRYLAHTNGGLGDTVLLEVVPPNE